MLPPKGACDPCRKKKVQCYGLPPPCTRCKHHAIDCTFEQLASRAASRSATSGARASGETISNRIKRIEHALLSAQGSGLGDGLTSLAGLQMLPQSQTRDSRAKIYFAGHHVGHIGSFTGIPFISATGKAWIEECIGQKGPVDKICNIGPNWQASAAEHRPYSCVDNDQGGSKQAEFPSRRTVEHLFALYSSSGFSKFFYFLDPTLFKRALNAAYSSPTTANAGARAHVLAFVLMANQVQHELPGPRIYTDVCETLLAPLLPQIIGEPDSSSPTTFLMLMIYYVSHGREEQGLVCHSVACRHLFSLGAHVHPAHRSDRAGSSDDDNISELAQQHLRRLFWIAYWCDGELSVRTGRPPAIDEDYCDLTLPTEPDDDDDMRTNSSLKLALDPRDTTGNVGFGIADLQLSMITAQIGRRLYSASALRKTDAEILCAVRELDDELERWRNLVPEPRRPTLANDQSYLDDENSTINLDLEIRSSVRQLNYLHLIMIIHQASSRCRQWAAKDTEARQLQGISSSIAISLHASRATLGHMNFVSFHDSVGNIWTVLFFPIAAALNIFCNILLDPLSPSAAADLELISSTSDLIRRITTTSKGHGDAVWCPHLDIFVTELARLGRMAVNRANGRTQGLGQQV